MIEDSEIEFEKHKFRKKAKINERRITCLRKR